MARHSTLHIILYFDFCKRAGAGLGHGKEAPVDILIPNWLRLQPLIFQSLLHLNLVFCPKWVWLQVLQTCRRKNTYAMIPSAQNWVGSVFH